MSVSGGEREHTTDTDAPASVRPPRGPQLLSHANDTSDQPTMAEPLERVSRSSLLPPAPSLNSGFSSGALPLEELLANASQNNARSSTRPPPAPKILEQSNDTDETPTLGEPPMGSISKHRSSLLPPRFSLPPTTLRTGRFSLPPSSLGVGSLSRPSTSPAVVHAMHAEEAARARAFSRSIGVLCCIGLAFQPVLSPPLWLRGLLSTAIFLLLCVCIWVFRRARDEERYSRSVFRVFASACVAASPIIVFYCGAFSPAPLLITLGIAFFGLGDDERFALGAPGVAIVLYIALALLVITGVLPEVGLFSSVGAQIFSKIFMLVLVSSVLSVTLWQARLSRIATLDAIRKSNEASRLAAQREAQLNEAHINLERALRAGAGLAGRYSGLLAGQYILAEVIGRGAMGEVYAATHVQTQERAAVKLLSAAGIENPGIIERFMREGEMAKCLESPYVVRVLDVGATDEGAPFIAMELLVGQDLAHHLRQKKQLELPSAAQMIEQVARGLAAAHAASIIHRDLKPQNLFSSENESGEPSWKILDFGVSKIYGSSGTLTQNAVVGTPGYMSPEQAQGVDADFRSDLFSLGAVAYRALTGRPPFSGSDTPQILFEIVYKVPVRPSELVPTLPKDIDYVIAIALAKRRDDRFKSAEDFATAFAQASLGQLPRAIRDHARAIVHRHPWGRTIPQREKKEKHGVGRRQQQAS